MGDTTTLSVDAETLDRFKAEKDATDEVQPDAPDHTADSFLNALLDTWERVGEIPDGGPEAITDALSDEEVAVIGTQGAVVQEIADKISNADGTVDTDDLAREVSRQIDYAALAAQVADELEGRLR